MVAGADLKVFVDSNVLISGIFSASGTPAQILELHSNGRLHIIVCRLIIEEVVHTITKKKTQALPALQMFLTSSPPEIVKNPPLQEIERWTKILQFEDAVILAAAISAGPDYFVTGDRHFYIPSLAEKSGLHIVTPAQLLRIITK